MNQSSQISFSHQTLLDTLAVRDSLSKGDTLKGFILRHPPMPFIRPSVRCFLFYLRAHEPDEFSKQVWAVLDNQDIAYHLRRLIAESLAEINPCVQDWKLISRLLRKHVDLFRRFFWRTQGEVWFDLFSENLFQMLLDDSTYENLHLDFVSKLQTWMNIRPSEVVKHWQQILNTQNKEICWQILINLDKFECWDTDGARKLLETLINLEDKERLFLGKAISHYVEVNNSGDDLLWQYITADIEIDKNKSFISMYDDLKLNCELYPFHNKSFLEERLLESNFLLTTVINSIEKWSSQYGHSYANGLRGLFLHKTTWKENQEKTDTHHVDSLEILFYALEKAIKLHSKKFDQWWQLHEPELRKSNEIALSYILIQAYSENIEENILTIQLFLQRHEFFQYSELNYELGELLRDAFPYLPNTIQERIQKCIFSLLDDYRDNAEQEIPKWGFKNVYDYFSWIPVIYRLPEVQDFIEKWDSEFEHLPQHSEIHSTGGIVSSPVSVKQMLALSPDSLIRLFKYYNKKMKDEWDLLIGVKDEVVSTFRECCTIEPIRFFSVIEKTISLKVDSAYTIALLGGVTWHLRYSTGSSRPSKEWKPVEPLPDNNNLALLILDWLEKYEELWKDGRAVAESLKACCEVLSDL